MSSGMADQVAVVTGGGGGIGRAVAQAFGAAGATVAVVDLDADKARQTVALLEADGQTARAYALDVAEPSAVERTWVGIAADLGGMDVLINGAGFATVSTLDRMPPEDWLRVVGVNLNGPFFCTHYAVPYLRRRGGSIVNVSSVAGKWIAYYAGVHYAATKAGLLSLTRQSALELARWDIRVNAVCPGPMENRMGGGLHDDQRMDNLPLGRRVRAAEVADAVLFLCSPAAQMITGVDLPVDGGFLTSTGADYATYLRVKGETLDRGQQAG